MRSRPPKKRSRKGARVASTSEHDNRTIAVVAKISPRYMVPGIPGGRNSNQRTTLVMARPTMTSVILVCGTPLCLELQPAHDVAAAHQPHQVPVGDHRHLA